MTRVVCTSCGGSKGWASKLCMRCAHPRPVIEQPEDPRTRLIALTKGLVAQVSTHRFDELNKHRWVAWWNKDTKSYYAVRNAPMVRGVKGSTIYMHRVILGLEEGNPIQGDHIKSGDTLNNQDLNLRRGSASQNHMNARVGPRNKLGLKGVSWSKKMKLWQAQIGKNKKNFHLGFYADPMDAHKAYAAAASELHGEFARLT